MERLRYGLCGLLALGTLGHLYGTFEGYAPRTEVFVWSLAGVGFAASVVSLNLIATSGHRGHLLAAALASVTWAGLALAFGDAVGTLADPRALAHAVPALALAALNGAGLARGSARRKTRSSDTPPVRG
jgi:hypothetical protein